MLHRILTQGADIFGLTVWRVVHKKAPNLWVLGGLWTIRNVWSAAVLQAKDEDDRIGLRECIRPLSE
jgi:hypothetical protein